MFSLQVCAEALGGTLLAFALTMFVALNVSVSRELWLARQETSRFQLFAARQHLLMLVAEGKMKEQDEAWRGAYERINFFLRMDQKLDVLDLMWRYVRSQVESERNPKVKLRLEHVRNVEKRAAANVPEFNKVLGEVIRAMLFLVGRRTNWFHRLVLWLFVNVGSLLATVGPATERKTAARKVRRSVARPSSDNFVQWQIVETDCFA